MPTRADVPAIISMFKTLSTPSNSLIISVSNQQKELVRESDMSKSLCQKRIGLSRAEGARSHEPHALYTRTGLDVSDCGQGLKGYDTPRVRR